MALLLHGVFWQSQSTQPHVHPGSCCFKGNSNSTKERVVCCDSGFDSEWLGMRYFHKVSSASTKSQEQQSKQHDKESCLGCTGVERWTSGWGCWTTRVLRREYVARWLLCLSAGGGGRLRLTDTTPRRLPLRWLHVSLMCRTAGSQTVRENKNDYRKRKEQERRGRGRQAKKEEEMRVKNRKEGMWREK